MTNPRLRLGPKLTAASFGVILIASSGCSSTPDETVICPPVALVGDAMTVTRFAPGRGQDLTDVDYTAEVSDIQSNCTVVGGENGQETVVVALAPTITAIRGPANADRRAEVDYLVSVTDQSRNILTVERFSVSMEFVGNRNRASITDNDPPVTVAIPLAAGTPADAYEIFVAFQLTPEQLDYNRRTQDRRP